MCEREHNGQLLGVGSTIVCAVDIDDDRSRRPLSVGADLAERLGRPLVVAYVELSAPVPPGGPDLASGAVVGAPGPVLPHPYPVGADDAQSDELRDDARRGVEQLLEQWGFSDVEIEVALDATAADGLRRIAADRDAELLVVGSRRRGAVSAVLLGSTSHALAGDAPCPVVVVPVSD